MVISTMLSEKFVADSRDAAFRLSIPWLGDFGLAPPLLLFWVQLAMYLLVASFFTTVTAVIIWEFVVRRRGSSTSYMVAYGVVVPSMLILPCQLVTMMEVRNSVLSAPLVVLPPLNILRCMEALYGTTRPYVEAGFLQFLFYYVSPVTFVFDRKSGHVLRATKTELVSKTIKLFLGFFETTLLLNLLVASDFHIVSHHVRQSMLDYFHWQNVLNNLALAYLCEIYLEFGTRATAIIISLTTGFETMEVNDNPLSQSTTVSEFWGKRWNRLVGDLLRVGVFKPVLKGCGSRSFAVFATFLVSGVYHEFILANLHIVGYHEGYSPNYLAQLSFFLWNGGALLLENVLWGNDTLVKVARKLPHRIKNILVLMTVLPISHWFLDEYIAVGLFTDFAVAFPLIRKV